MLFLFPFLQVMDKAALPMLTFTNTVIQVRVFLLCLQPCAQLSFFGLRHNRLVVK